MKKPLGLGDPRGKLCSRTMQDPQANSVHVCCNPLELRPKVLHQCEADAKLPPLLNTYEFISRTHAGCTLAVTER